MTANEEQAIKHGAHTENDILNAMPCAVILSRKRMGIFTGMPPIIGTMNSSAAPT